MAGPRSNRGWKPLPQNLNLLADETLPQMACNAQNSELDLELIFRVYCI